MSKTVSSRLPNKKHDELRERCNKLGCTMNEFIENSILFMLDGSSDFEFDLDELIDNNQLTKTKTEPSEVKVIKIE